jgi:isoquinoline 1-oxidoreductase beta subunit
VSAVVVVDRRAFLKLTGLTAGALVLGCRGSGIPAGDPSQTWEPDLFLSLDGGGGVTIVAHRSEMGQGIRTALPMVVADELEADFDRVEVVQALGDERYGSQNTDGSHSVRDFFEPMRKVGATGRHMLVAAAAAHWGVDASECRAENHRVLHDASGRSAGYGDLVAKAAEQAVPDESALQLKSPQDWRYIGKAMNLVDVDAMVTGRAVFGIDATVDGMLHASIERCPTMGGKAVSWDAEAAKKVKGVRHVVEIPVFEGAPAFNPLGGIAVVADHTWAAIQGRQALNVKWDKGAHGSYDSAAYRKQLEATAKKPAKVVRRRGDVDAALAGAAKRISADYYAPHLSQSPMEPPAALASFSGDRCEVWACTQHPVGVQEQVAATTGIPKENVTVHVTLIGGGFGRKSKADFSAEAAFVSKAVGAPVKVTWTREDDVRHGYYHSVSAQHLEGGLDADGQPVAWLHRTVFPSISSTFAPDARHASVGELGLGFVDWPYAIPNLRLENGEARAHVRIGWLRSVCNIYHAFAIGSFIDELAHAAGADPKQFLLDVIGEGRTVDLAAEDAEYENYGASIDDYPIDAGRLRRVVEMAADAAGWGEKRPEGRALGIAAHRSFLTYVANVIEVSVDDDGEIRVGDVHVAYDCGRFVNRDSVITQAQGAVIFGLSGALDGKITAKDGAIEQSNYHDYTILRVDEAPRNIHVHLVESDAPPAGVGEPGVPPVAPALASAIFAATGERRRELPLRGAKFA